MPFAPLVVCFPTSDRPTSYAFYRDGLQLETVGELADDGVPEPLQVVVNDGVRLMLIPTGGFGWIAGGREVAHAPTSECVLSISAASPEAVDAMVAKARGAGAAIVTEPADQGWAYTGAFADPDGHVWMVRADPPPA